MEGISTDCAPETGDKFFVTLLDGEALGEGKVGNGVPLLAFLTTPTVRSPDGVMLRWPLGRSGQVLRSSFVK